MAPETMDTIAVIPTVEQELKFAEETEEVVADPTFDIPASEIMNNSSNKPKPKVTPIAKVSVSGSFLVCVQGFFGSRGSFSSKVLSQSNTIAVDISILPDGLKKRSTLSSFLPATSSDFEAFIEWNKVLSVAVPWSSHQVLIFFYCRGIHFIIYLC
jgi:hypothetical protein